MIKYLANGMITLLDDEDAHILGDLKWYATRASQVTDRYYAAAGSNGRTVYLHRLIMCAPKGITVDHRDGNGLDNRRPNLRLATRSQNNANRESVSGTGFRGVERMQGSYRAHIAAPPEGRFLRKKIHLGYYPTAEEAARAYDAAATERWGEFARLNFPGTSP